LSTNQTLANLMLKTPKRIHFRMVKGMINSIGVSGAHIGGFNGLSFLDPSKKLEDWESIILQGIEGGMRHTWYHTT
jgi:hypothetical protein